VQPDESEKAQFRGSVESLIHAYIAQTDMCEMPVLEDWVLVATVNDLGADENGKWVYLRGDKQSTHRTVGLLITASDTLREITKDDD
jgi:hypothetical protein